MLVAPCLALSLLLACGPGSPARPPSVTLGLRPASLIAATARRCHEGGFEAPGELKELILFKGLDPGTVDAQDVVQQMRGGDDEIEAALDALHAETGKVCLSMPRVLSEGACRSLRGVADARARECETIDAMDGLSEEQVAMTRQDLEKLIGKEEVETLWGLPQKLEEVREGGHPTLPPVWLATVSVRKYCAIQGQRTSLGFHVDSDSCTANVALGGEYTGGDLLLAVGGKIVKADTCGRREVGDAILHVGEVAHAVTRVSTGSRYSLLLFFTRPGFMFQKSKGSFKRPATKPT